MLTAHTPAPLDVSFQDETHTTRTLRDFLGSWVVLYFYPRDNTPGCTLEAEGFRDMIEEFKARNAVVLGVSTDSCASHERFIQKRALTFSLVSDTEHALMDAFGVWGERSFMGKRYMGTSRSTFLIDPSGTIVRVWEKVTPLGHPKEVLAEFDARAEV